VSEYWSEQEQALKPACVVNPSSAQDVSAALKVLLVNRACQFAVKGGGHMAFAGAANIQDGITIDLGDLNQFSYSSNTGLATFGPGLRWGDVYTKLAAYGRGAAGGRSADVGVGGYLLGGMYQSEAVQ
jgi:FAD/FMN-containing dehydrogenase